MVTQPVELVKYVDGKGRSERHIRLVASQYGIELQNSPDGDGNWKCQAVINLEAAIQFAKALIEFVELTTDERRQAEEDAAFDKHVDEMYQRRLDRIDAESMALEAAIGF